MIRLPCYFTGFASRADGSASLRFATQEISAGEFAGLKADHNAFGWLVFKGNEEPIEDHDLPKGNAVEEGLTSSERLRRVMFVYWKQKVGEGDFEAWRRQRIERLIEQYKEKLD